MKIIVSGASGLVGSHLVNYLMEKNHQVLRLVRSGESGSEKIKWNPSNNFIENLDSLEGIDVAVHLSGENVVGLWTDEKKKRIRNSRINTTKFLVETFSELEKPPKCFICASAVGYYGNRGDEELTEDSSPDSGFLPDICIDWEKEANKAAEVGVRVVNLRIGVVLSKNGGALKMMLTPYKFGLGGVVGSGKQYWSWVSIEDISRIIEFVADNENINGPINTVSPDAITNKEFSDTLAYVLKRPAFLPVPSFLIKLLFGEFGEHALLASTRVLPKKLLDYGFEFKHKELEATLREIL